MYKLICLLALALISSQVIAGQDVLISAGAKTTTQTTADIYKVKEKGAHIIVVITSAPGVDTITPKVQGKDYLGNYYDLIVGTAASTTGTYVIKIYPGIGQIANGAASDFLPDIYRVIVTHSAASSFNYTVTINKAE